MKIFLRYLKDHWKIIFFVCVAIVIEMIVFYLYRLEMDAFWYGLILLCVCLVFGFVYDYVQYYKKHKVLSLYDMDILNGYKPTSLIEYDLLEAYKQSQQEKRRIVEQKDEMVRQTMDYFTLWVHQVKLPIAAMKLLLEDKTVDRKECKGQLLRIDQYTDMVLTYLRLHSEQTDYIFKEYNLDDLIRQAIHRFSYEFIRKKIALDYKGVSKNLITDEKWFVFVLEQLLSNALKYSSNHSTISIYEEDNFLIIQNQGRGIDAADLARIFEKGYTGLNGRMDKKASGLGLYLCKMICDNLSCSLEIQSTLGEGTKVILGFNQYEIS